VLKIFKCLKLHGRNLDERLEIILDVAINSSLLCFANSSKQFLELKQLKVNYVIACNWLCEVPLSHVISQSYYRLNVPNVLTYRYIRIDFFPTQGEQAFSENASASPLYSVTSNLELSAVTLEYTVIRVTYVVYCSNLNTQKHAL
jgi:hypothetical protein